MARRTASTTLTTTKNTVNPLLAVLHVVDTSELYVWALSAASLNTSLSCTHLQASISPVIAIVAIQTRSLASQSDPPATTLAIIPIDTD